MARVETGNTFNGYIHEFNGVRDSKYYQKKPYLQVLESNLEVELPYKDTRLKVVAIPSNHCPGSVMFLVSDLTYKTNVLLTGDIRAEQRWIDTIIKNPYLYPFTTKLKSLDNIYLDTTYGYRTEPFIIMPKNSDGLNKLTNILADYPHEDEDIHFYFTDSNLGFEEVWSLILPLFTDKVHIIKPIMDKLEKIFEYDQESCYSKKFQTMFKINGANDCNFHVSNRPIRSKHNIFNVVVKPVINIDKDTYEKMNATPQESQLTFAYETKKGHKVYKRSYLNPYGTMVDSYHLKHKDTGIILNDTIAYFFSRHSSYDECLNLVSQFNVKQIYPTTESNITWSAGFQIARHFGKLLTNDEFLYDKIGRKIYGPQPLISLNPTVVDILTNNEFNGVEFLTEYKQKSFGLDFKGQKPLKNAFGEDHLTNEERQIIRDYKQAQNFNKMIAGTNHYRQQRIHNETPEIFLQQLIEKTERSNAKNQEESYNDGETDDGYSTFDESEFNFELSPIKIKLSYLEDLDESTVSVSPKRSLEKPESSQVNSKKRRLDLMKQHFDMAELEDLNQIKTAGLNKDRINEIEKIIKEDSEFCIRLTSLIEERTKNDKYQ